MQGSGVKKDSGLSLGFEGFRAFEKKLRELGTSLDFASCGFLHRRFCCGLGDACVPLPQVLATIFVQPQNDGHTLQTLNPKPQTLNPKPNGSKAPKPAPKPNGSKAPKPAELYGPPARDRQGDRKRGPSTLIPYKLLALNLKSHLKPYKPQTHINS